MPGAETDQPLLRPVRVHVSFLHTQVRVQWKPALGGVGAFGGLGPLPLQLALFSPFLTFSLGLNLCSRIFNWLKTAGVVILANTEKTFPGQHPSHVSFILSKNAPTFIYWGAFFMETHF